MPTYIPQVFSHLERGILPCEELDAVMIVLLCCQMQWGVVVAVQEIEGEKLVLSIIFV